MSVLRLPKGTHVAPGGSVKAHTHPMPVVPGWGPRFCISGVLPDEADAAGPGPSLWVVGDDATQSFSFCMDV